MNGRAIRLSVALVVGLFAVPGSQACIELDPRLSLEFEEGSAELVRAQSDRIAELFLHGRNASEYRISVRGYADRSAGFDPRRWTADDVALARQRAGAIARVARLLGAPCVEVVALGSSADDVPPPREDADGRHWRQAGVIVLATPGTHEEPPPGVSVETECGLPAPSAGAAH